MTSTACPACRTALTSSEMPNGNLVCRKNKSGSPPEGRHHRAGLALLPVALGDQPALLAGALPDAEQIALVHLHPVGAHVDIAGSWIAIDEGVAGPDITPAVAAVGLLSTGNLSRSTSLAHDVLHHRTGRDLFGRNRRRCSLWRAAWRTISILGVPGGSLERDRHAHARGGRNASERESPSDSLESVEHQRRRLIDQLEAVSPAPLISRFQSALRITVTSPELLAFRQE